MRRRDKEKARSVHHENSGVKLRSCRVQEAPDVLDDGVLYIVGEGLHLWYAAMLCPCSCGDILNLSLMPDSRSHWILRYHRNKTVTLWPSIARSVGCKSHFNIRRSRVVYWSDDTRSDAPLSK